MTKPIEVEATPINTELDVLSSADKWLASAWDRAEQLAQQYKPHEIESDQDYKDSKKARADARRDIGAIEAERKSLTADVEKFIRDFKDGAKRALEPLSGIDAEYKRQIDAYEEKWRENRLSELREAYTDFAPDLVPLVPFDRLAERFGTAKGKQWTARSTNIQAAKEALYAAVETIAADEQTVTAAVAPEDAEQAKAVYFTSLDVGQALRAAQDWARQRERVRELERQRQEREQEAARIAAETAQRAEIQAEEAKTQQAPASAEAVPNIGSQGVVSREEYEAEYAAVMGVPAPSTQSMREHIAISQGMPDLGYVPAYVFCGYGTAVQAEQFKEFCRIKGIERSVVLPTGGRQYKLTRR